MELRNRIWKCNTEIEMEYRDGTYKQNMEPEIELGNGIWNLEMEMKYEREHRKIDVAETQWKWIGTDYRKRQ